MIIKKIARRKVMLLVLFLWLVYCVSSLLTPHEATSTRFNLTPFMVNLLLFSLYVPVLVVWMFAVSSWLRFWQYTRKIPEETKKQGFFLITLGLMVLSINLIAPTLIRSVYGYLGGDVALPAWVIVNNFSSVLFPLISFSLMWYGAKYLVGRTDTAIPFLSKFISVIIPVSLFAIFYIYLVFTNPIRQASANSDIAATYFLPDILIIFTIILPVVSSWVLGLLLVLNLGHYANHTVTVNRRGLVSVYNGMVVIVATSILIQAINSLGGSRFQDVNLGIILVVLYALLGLLTFGMGMVAHGAKILEKPVKHKAEGKP